MKKHSVVKLKSGITRHKQNEKKKYPKNLN